MRIYAIRVPTVRLCTSTYLSAHYLKIFQAKGKLKEIALCEVEVILYELYVVAFIRPHSLYARYVVKLLHECRLHRNNAVTLITNLIEEHIAQAHREVV